MRVPLLPGILRPRVNPLAITAVTLVAAAAAGIAWLALTANEGPMDTVETTLTMPMPAGNAPAPASNAEPKAPKTAALGPPQTSITIPLAPQRRGPGPLAPAPDPELVEKTDIGILPIIGSDGRRPWKVYARPFDATGKRPRVAMVIRGLGLSATITETAIHRLPGTVTLAFTPYGADLNRWVATARDRGHEVLLAIPMEPSNYPTDDPGPHTLLTSATSDQNLDRLHWAMSRFTGYAGVMDFMGSHFTSSRSHLSPILKELKKRGLMFVDSRASLRSIAAPLATEIGLPRAVNNRFIDTNPARAAIDKRLYELERIAITGGHALGIGDPYPATIERVVAWIEGLEKKGVVVVPASAIADKQPD